MFGIAEVFGGVGNAELALKECHRVFHFVHLTVGLRHRRFGNEPRHLADGKFAQHALLPKAPAVTADGGLGIGEGAVVDDMELLQARENIVDIGGNFRAAKEFLL